MRFLCLSILTVIALLFVGCQTSPLNVDAMRPASIADVDAVREDLATSIGAVRDDLNAAQIASTSTTDVAGQLDANVAAAKAEASAPSASGGALIQAIAGSGVVPPGLDWLLSIFGPLLGLNAARNASRRKVLAKAAAPAPKPAVAA
jgi:hypothetical protein